MKLTPRDQPCPACPYRKDAPSGIWAQVEYEKLPAYDEETSTQPPGVFLCHDGDRDSVVCRGWLEVHGAQPQGHELLALRFAEAIGHDVSELLEVRPCGIPMHSSGREACQSGLEDVDSPSEQATRIAGKLERKHDLERG